MEIEVLGVDGVPPDTIVSIRAGASRRQAPVSALAGGVPFRFPTGSKGLNPFKVDLFQPICSARLALKPEAGVYECPIDNSGVKVKFTVNESGKDPNGPQPPRMEALPIGVQPDSKWPALLPREDDPNFPSTAAAVKDYLDNHHLLKFVKALLQTVVREQPRDPFQFIADQFRTAATAAKTGGDVTSQLGLASQADARELASLDRPRTSSLLETPDDGTIRNLATDALTAAALNAAFKAAGVPVGEDTLKAVSRDLPPQLVSKTAVDTMTVAVQRPTTPEVVQKQSAPAPAQQPVGNLLGERQLPASGGAQNEPELQVAVEAAKEALQGLLNVFATGDDMATRGETPPTGVDIESAKQEAIQALLTVMDASGAGDAADAQRQALDTMAAVLDEEDSSRPGSAPLAGEELAAAKAGAIEALFAVMKSGDPDERSDVDFSGLFGNAIEDAKVNAVEQLHEEEEKKVLVDKSNVSEEVRLKAQEALSTALLKDADEMGLELEDKESLHEVPGDSANVSEEIRLKAQEALSTALLKAMGLEPEEEKEENLQEVPADPAKVSEEIRLKAQEALSCALLKDAHEMGLDLEDENLQEVDPAKVLEEIRLKAKEALSSALLKDAHDMGLEMEEESLHEVLVDPAKVEEEIRLKAKEALSRALLKDAHDMGLEMEEENLQEVLVDPAKVEEEIRLKAKEALSRALLKDADETGLELEEENLQEVLVDPAKVEEEIRLKAKEALSSALLKDADEMGLELEEENLQEATDAAQPDLLALKAKTKQALRSSMLGGSTSTMEMDALRATLGTPGQASEVGGVSAASVEIPAVPATGAREFRKQSFRESLDPPKAAAEEAKMSLLAAKKELLQLNTELRSEVTELSEVFEGLLKERELLKQQLTQA